MLRLQDRTALVTGAARGIGLAIARAFVAEGADVVLSDIRDDDGRDAAAACGSRAEYVHLDVRDEHDWIQAIAGIIERRGRLDVLVNNAGITGFEDGLVVANPEELTLEHWRAVMATNLEGVMLGCKHAIRAMRPKGAGSIINISSRSGLVGIPGAAAYAASKAGVRNHTKSVALWCAQEGLAIRCNSVHPAAILTPMWEPLLGKGPDREARMRSMVADTPLRRFGTPEEVAAICVHLAADESSYTTGCEFNVDGGMLAGSVAAPMSPSR
ncbi:MAG: glucose 1-dehydrogenase [Planctomycetes bacterium]|nr:glucose 1-dehydrogenase [Planctomycetota bacterium]MBI3846833.1 glucose 1-dehydrogenase [Planctomycetota bacterium]